MDTLLSKTGSSGQTTPPALDATPSTGGSETRNGPRSLKRVVPQAFVAAAVTKKASLIGVPKGSVNVSPHEELMKV